VDLGALWAVDRELDELKAEARKLSARVEGHKVALAEREAERAALAAQVAEHQKKEAELDRSLRDYAGRRDRMKALIDTGAAQDYAGTQRTMEQCAAKAGELEEQILLLMEAREALEKKVVELDRAIGFARQVLEEARAAQIARRPGLEQRYRALEALRPERLKAVPHHHHSRYQELRRKGQAPVVWVKAGICEQCNFTVQPQVLGEMIKDRGPHHCRGCGAYLYDIRPESEG
jgi:predicted  nucleic acid-binding Zn-ribbon protein